MPLRSLDTGPSTLVIEWDIHAPQEQVWQVLTTPNLLAEWLGTLTSGEVTANSSFTVEHGEGYHCESTVIASETPKTLIYSWEFPDEPCTNVSWTLTAMDDETTLRLTHSNLVELTDSYRDGWITHLTFLEASALGDPLPWSAFWPLHSTIQQLNTHT